MSNFIILLAALYGGGALAVVIGLVCSYRKMEKDLK